MFFLARRRFVCWWRGYNNCLSYPEIALWHTFAQSGKKPKSRVCLLKLLLRIGLMGFETKKQRTYWCQVKNSKMPIIFFSTLLAHCTVNYNIFCIQKYFPFFCNSHNKVYFNAYTDPTLSHLYSGPSCPVKSIALIYYPCTKVRFFY